MYHVAKALKRTVSRVDFKGPHTLMRVDLGNEKKAWNYIEGLMLRMI